MIFTSFKALSKWYEKHHGKEVNEMLISKFYTKDGKTSLNIVVDKKWIKDCKNPNYCHFYLSPDFLIGLDGKKQKKVCELMNLHLIPYNNPNNALFQTKEIKVEKSKK